MGHNLGSSSGSKWVSGGFHSPAIGAQGIPMNSSKPRKLKIFFGGRGSNGHPYVIAMKLIGPILRENSSPVDPSASRNRCKKVKPEASSACLCVLAAWRTIYAWTSASASSGASRGRALHRAQCTARRALHQCIPKVHPTCWRAAAKSRPNAFDLTCSLFQTVLSLPARLESVLDEM